MKSLEKNYHKRIHLDSKDEFGQMVNAFNAMARQLDHYESSSLAKILFEKKRIETIINQMDDAVFGLDAEGKILFINWGCRNLISFKSRSYSWEICAGYSVRTMIC